MNDEECEWATYAPLLIIVAVVEARSHTWRGMRLALGLRGAAASASNHSLNC